MIISASRRTDIPSLYSEWFFNRIKEKYVMVRNPMNIHQVSKIDLSPDVVDCIVFWSKNPKPMMRNLNQLKDYIYYFQFTLNSYGKEIEKNIPSKNNNILYTFKELSDKIGPEKIIWRYDPIFLSDKYTIDYHIEYFSKIARQLKGYTEKCIISFIDIYSSISKNIFDIGLYEPDNNQKMIIAKNLSEIAKLYGIEINTCAEKIELNNLGISHGKCIDDKLISRLSGVEIEVGKDKNQRMECGCVESIDIGIYNSCMNCCRYCYANHNIPLVEKNYKAYDPKSPLLCSEIEEIDSIKNRKVKSFKNNQLSFL